MFNHCFYEEILPNIQLKPPHVQTKTTYFYPVVSRLREEVSLHLATTPFHTVVESSEVTPEHPFLQAKQFQLSQLHGVIVAKA